MVLLSSAPVGAQGVTVSALKAAFLYNFANFAEWPAGALAPGQPLLLCVAGDNAVASALQQTIHGREVDQHVLAVEVVTADGPFQACHLLYVSGLTVKQAEELLASLKTRPIFTVSDGERFAERGGVAQLVLEKQRMRFAVNVRAAERANLRISSKLLSLATIIKDRDDVQR